MKIDLSYFVVYKSNILELSNEATLEKFLKWNKEHSEMIRLPWDDWLYNLEGWVTDDEDFEAQEEVFTECDLDIQNLIYKLKKYQLKQEPNSKADLCFEG